MQRAKAARKEQNVGVELVPGGIEAEPVDYDVPGAERAESPDHRFTDAERDAT